MSLRKDISASVYTQITDVELEYVYSFSWPVLLLELGNFHACLHVDTVHLFLPTQVRWVPQLRPLQQI